MEGGPESATQEAPARGFESVVERDMPKVMVEPVGWVSCVVLVLDWDTKNLVRHDAGLQDITPAGQVGYGGTAPVPQQTLNPRATPHE